MGIKAIYPCNRTSQLIVMDDSSQQMRVNSTQNPLYYRTPDDILMPVNVADIKATKVGIGDICLRDASVTSVGFKVANDAYKYIGFRPDCVQDGSEQLEFSIIKIEFDGKAQTIDLSSNTAKTPFLTEIGPLVYVQSTRQGTRQLVKVADVISSFKIVYQLDVTGLDLIERKDIDEFWFYSKRTKDFRFRIVKPYLVNTNGTPHDICGAVRHSLVSNEDGTYTYTKENTIDLIHIDTPYYIDADTVYSTTADGYVKGDAGYDADGSAATAWAEAIAITSGTAYSSDNSSVSAVGVDYYANGLIYSFNIFRSFFYFSLASVTTTILSASINLFGLTNSNCNVCVQQGTQSDTLAGADINNFSGSSWGNTSSWSTSGYNSITLNSSGLAAATSAIGGTFKVCARDYTYDYANNRPSADKYSGMYFANNTGTTNDPYLLLTLGPAKLKGLNGLGVEYVKTINGLELSLVKTLSGL